MSCSLEYSRILRTHMATFVISLSVRGRMYEPMWGLFRGFLELAQQFDFVNAFGELHEEI